jgi:undecaprenyl-diphosphatase
MAALTTVGGGWGALSIVPFFVPARTRRFAAAFGATIGVNALVVYALKALVARPRPWAVLPDIHPLVVPGPSDFSFPSGHAAGAFCYATFVIVVLWKTRRGPLPIAASGILFFLACGVALSRIALGVHFPGDITAGAIIGVTSGAMGANLHLRRAKAARLCLPSGTPPGQTTRPNADPSARFRDPRDLAGRVDGCATGPRSGAGL